MAQQPKGENMNMDELRKKEMHKIASLGDIQIARLRKDVVLNSLFTYHYLNRYHINAVIVRDFFDGYMEYITELEKENGEDLDWREFLGKYDTPANLRAWRDCVACGLGE